MMSTVFQRIGPYEVLEEIGRGGMASVFLARDSRDGADVALKLVPLRDTVEAREILDAERRGAMLQARLSRSCPLVPKVFETGEIPSYYFIAMEYVEGENLSDVIARGPVETTAAVRIAHDLCLFLQAAHQFETTIDGVPFRSLLHGDLKPGNVRVSPDARIKVLDFGIAKALSLSRKVTRNDFGSMPYMSPERLDSADAEIGRPADMWALGVILYELLSGAPPFAARDTRQLERQIRSGYARRPLPDDVPAGLRAIAARMLAPSLGDRYESATGVMADLELFASGRSTIAEEQGFPRPPEDEATRRTHATPSPAEDEATRRTRAPAADSEATRRDRVPDGAVPAGVPEQLTTAGAIPAVVPGRPHRPLSSWVARISWPGVLLVLAIVVVLNELAVGFSADRLAASTSARDLEGVGAAWDDYARLSSRSLLRVGVTGLESMLRTRSLEVAGQVIANYRSPQPTVRERQWKAAQKNLQQAVVLAPGDTRLRAALRYCDGHVHRIDGEAERARNRPLTAKQQFSEAVAAFREAAELRSDWPDPFLGLARTFIYGLDDIDRGADALTQAQQRGYTSGERETAQLGDGYRVRGDNLRQTARQLAKLPQEEDYLRRSQEAYRQALSLYERIPGYAGVATNLRRVGRSIDEIDRRLAELTAGKTDRQNPVSRTPAIRDPRARSWA